MTRTARVHSVESISEFRSHLIEFGAKARDALATIEMQIRRMVDWLGEKQKYWQHEIRARTEEVTRAKIELEQRKNMNRQGSGPGTTDHEKALKKALARLKEAEEKFANCKRWKPLLDHAIQEYYGPARSLGGALEMDLAKAVSTLESKIRALEAYLAMAPPTTDPSTSGSASADPSAAIPIEAPPGEPEPRLPESGTEDTHGFKQVESGTEGGPG